jgi:UDP-glucuronate 4-epimerase
MSNHPERILVTGAAGFIGSHLVERLLSRGATVIGVDNFDPFYSPDEKRSNLAAAASHPCFRLVSVDCADLPELEAGVGNDPIDAVIHLAAKAGVRPSLLDPLGYLRANVMATQSVLELARRRGIGRIVFGSSSSVYGNNAKVPFSEGDRTDEPISPYAASKRAAELLCATHHHLHGTGILALRFFTVYGPRQRPDLAIRKFATLMLQGRSLPLYGDGHSERDYTWIDDILDGVLAALARTRHVPGEYETINLGGHRTTSLTRLVELLAQALAVEPVIERLPPQPGDVDRTWADVTKARLLLGYVPRTPIEEGIPRFATWMKERTPPERRERPRTSVPTDQNR